MNWFNSASKLTAVSWKLSKSSLMGEGLTSEKDLSPPTLSSSIEEK